MLVPYYFVNTVLDKRGLLEKGKFIYVKSLSISSLCKSASEFNLNKLTGTPLSITGPVLADCNEVFINDIMSNIF